MIVGLSTASTRKERRVAGADRMTIEEVVKKVLLEEQADDAARGGRSRVRAADGS
jgi:hypothetical protein